MSRRMVLTVTAGRAVKIGRPYSPFQLSFKSLHTVLVLTGLSPQDDLLFGTSRLMVLKP